MTARKDLEKSLSDFDENETNRFILKKLEVMTAKIIELSRKQDGSSSTNTLLEKSKSRPVERRGRGGGRGVSRRRGDRPGSESALS